MNFRHNIWGNFEVTDPFEVTNEVTDIFNFLNFLRQFMRFYCRGANNAKCYGKSQKTKCSVFELLTGIFLIQMAYSGYKTRYIRCKGQWTGSFSLSARCPCSSRVVYRPVQSANSRFCCAMGVKFTLSFLLL